MRVFDLICIVVRVYFERISTRLVSGVVWVFWFEGFSHGFGLGLCVQAAAAAAAGQRTACTRSSGTSAGQLATVRRIQNHGD